MHMRRVTCLLVAASVLAACESDSFVGDGGADSGADVPGVGGGDGSADAPGDAPKDVAIAVPRFCDSIDAAFCADFDVPGDAGAGWTGPIITSGSFTHSFETAQHTSAPNGFEVDIPDASDGGTTSFAALIGNPQDAGALVQAVLDFDVIIPPLSGPSVPFYTFYFGCPFGNLNTRYALSYIGGWTFTNLQGATIPITGTVPTGVWTHVKMTIILSQTGNVKLDIGNGTATAMIGTDTVNGAPPPYPIDLSIGPSCAGYSPPASIVYDNVVVHTL